MKKLILTAILGVFGVSAANAQDVPPHKCGSYEHLRTILENNPEVKESYEAYQLLRNSHVGTTEENGKSVQEYVIPVVFHILHQYGTENISDAQVYDAVEVFNREFNAQDGDSVDIVPEFQDMNGNAHITFKLAAIDPFGNCTNGIEHVYSHETNIGDAYSKINQWNRSKYLNIWVVDIVGVPGAAAYATFPASTDGSNFWVDGVLSRHSYVGSIGTSSTFNESVLTHEIGHWLGLAHTFGNSDLINNGPTICNDDGIADTPMTKGHQHCNFLYPTEWIDCDTTNGGVVEDLQNYMDYSYCDRHFTPGQCTAMRNVMTGIAGQRNNLWNDTTLLETGVLNLLTPQDPNDPLTVPLCVPIADYHANQRTVCSGDIVTFSDESWNAVVDSRQWIFEDGSPATSTSSTANVSFSGHGWKNVTLIVTNAAGSDTLELDRYLYVAQSWPENYGPTSFDLESTDANGTGTDYFVVQNLEENYGKYAPVDNNGYGQSRAFKLGNYKDVSGTDPFTNDAFYNARLGLSVDNLITPSVDLRNTSNITVTFKYAYATNATLEADITETLKVYSTRNCGGTWTPRILSVDGSTVGNSLSGDDLVTAGYASNSDFAPTNDMMWRTASFSYTSNSLDELTRFKFEFVASDYASNLYIDEINIDGVLNVEDATIHEMELVVFPNPSNGEAIHVNYQAQDQATTFVLRDVNGKLISTQTIDVTNASVSQELNNTSDLPAGCYFLEVQTGDYTTIRKVVVM